MPSSSILGYPSMAVGEPLKPFYFDPPEMGESDVRVWVTHCGLCHTDIQAVDDYYSITEYPFVPGHEIVGYISQVGEAVSSIKIGDRVGIGWQGRSCMQCEWCMQGQKEMSMDIVESATCKPFGGFSSSIVVDHRFAYPLPEEMSSEFSCCADVRRDIGVHAITQICAATFSEGRHHGCRWPGTSGDPVCPCT